MDEYHELTDTDPSCSLRYLLSDLMHMCDRDPDFERFEQALERARALYKLTTSTPKEYRALRMLRQREIARLRL